MLSDRDKSVNRKSFAVEGRAKASLLVRKLTLGLRLFDDENTGGTTTICGKSWNCVNSVDMRNQCVVDLKSTIIRSIFQVGGISISFVLYFEISKMFDDFEIS